MGGIDKFPALCVALRPAHCGAYIQFASSRFVVGLDLEIFSAAPFIRYIEGFIE